MSSRDFGEVLRCQRCNKPFDQESTLKRHGYYCRAQTTPKAPRSRACLSCVKAKARCDNVRPQCSRCLEKGGDCVYPTKTVVSHSKCPKESQQSLNDRPDHALGADDASAPFTFSTTCDQALRDLSTETFDANWEEFGASIPEFVDDSIFDPSVRFKNSIVAALFPQSTPFLRSVLEVQRAFDMIQNSVPPPPSLAIRSFNRRLVVHMSPKCQKLTNNIFSTVTAYPIQMVRDNTLPPFLHSSLQPGNGIEDREMEPLFNCLNLLNMAGSRIRGSRKLFWRNVRMECEQMCHTHKQFSHWYLLTGLQAVSLYTLVRIHEGPTDDNNLDALLLATILTLYQDMVNRSNTLHHLSLAARESLDKMWKAWMFEESVRRLGVLYHILHQVVYWDAISQCRLQPDLLIAPLPARKALWDARDESSWFDERSDLSRSAEYGLGVNGELVQLLEGQRLCAKPLVYYDSNDRTESARVQKWKDWAAEMDGLGGVIVLAASLIAPD